MLTKLTTRDLSNTFLYIILIFLSYILYIYINILNKTHRVEETIKSKGETKLPY